MPSNYIFKCTNCQKTQKRYRNVKKCTACGGLLERVEYLEEGQLIHRHGYKMNRDGHFDVVREEDLAELESALTTAQEENKRLREIVVKFNEGFEHDAFGVLPNGNSACGYDEGSVLGGQFLQELYEKSLPFLNGGKSA